jgi:amidohydrolase
MSAISADLHANPELCFEETFACRRLSESLTELGLDVQVGVGGLETAFRAEFGPTPAQGRGGATIAVLAEYDALPEIGHACGHNLIAAGAIGAIAGLLAVRDELPGRVVVLGTPAEEGGGGKVKLIDAGQFADIDGAMMFHPYDRDLLWKPALACDEVEFRFTGQASHAAAGPWNGRSALTAALQTIHLVDAIRVHFHDGTRVHGFVKKGGEAVNIIPDKAAVRFSVRAPTRQGLDELRGRVIDCARGAALATRTDVEVEVETGYSEMRNNRTLYERFAGHFDRAAPTGEAPVDWEVGRDVGAGSTDMGDVSQVCPSIHPYIAICDLGETAIHQRRFAELAAGDRALDSTLRAAAAMACTAWDFLADDTLRGDVIREWETSAARS